MNNQIAKIQKLFERIKLPRPFFKFSRPFASPLQLRFKSKTLLNAGIFELNILSDLAKGD